MSPSVLVTCTHRPFRSHLRLIEFYYIFQWFDSSKCQGTLSVWLHATKLWSCNFIKLRIRNLSSSTALLCVSVDMTRGRDAAWQRAPLVLQMSTVFLKHAAEGSLASGCLQAVITQLLLPDTTKVSRSGEEQSLSDCWGILYQDGGNLCRCPSDLPSIFHDHVISNYVAGSARSHWFHLAAPPTAATSASPSQLEELARKEASEMFSPRHGFLKYTNHVRPVNQKWKAIRWDVEYVPLHNSSCGLFGQLWLLQDRWHTAPCRHRAGTSICPLCSCRGSATA